MLQAGLEPGQHQGETFGGVDHPRDDLFRVPTKPLLRMLTKVPAPGSSSNSHSTWEGLLSPFGHSMRMRRFVCRSLHFDFLGNPVHVPVPAQPFPRLRGGHRRG